jgi:hypothetical protein
MKRQTIRRTMSLVIATGTLISMTFAAAQPASAEDVIRCNSDTAAENKITIDPPAVSGDPRLPVTIEIDLCVGRDDPGNKRAAWARSVFWNGSDGLHPATKRFHSFQLEVRLEQNDVIKSYLWCTYDADLNEWTDSNYAGKDFSCKPSGWDVFTSQGGWTADATVRYDIAYDGLGQLTWQLGGTASTP